MLTPELLLLQTKDYEKHPAKMMIFAPGQTPNLINSYSFNKNSHQIDIILHITYFKLRQW